MAWPIPDDYRQALQNAHNNLIPAALKPVSPQMDKLGRPRVQTGAFAAVFEVTDTTGTRWALRCFTRTVPDGQQRYQAIAQAIQAAALPYFVAFHYIEEGVRIAGEAYPLVQMEWLEGESFASYVEHNITNASELQRLARQVHGLVMDLELKGLAHGDLSGDNMRVVGGQLRLIDYDGIYSRHLQGLKPPEEVGTEHFRHPLRPAEPFFGPTMDRFSALLCITSLHALSVEPSLWGRFGATDRLIFKESDLLKPRTADIFGVLLNHADPEVRRLSSELYAWCSLRPAQVPALPVLPAPPIATRGGFGSMRGKRFAQRTPSQVLPGTPRNTLLSLGAGAGLLVLGVVVGRMTQHAPERDPLPVPRAEARAPATDETGTGPLMSLTTPNGEVTVAPTPPPAQSKKRRRPVGQGGSRYPDTGGNEDIPKKSQAEQAERVHQADLLRLHQQVEQVLEKVKTDELQGDYITAVNRLSSLLGSLNKMEGLSPGELRPLHQRVMGEQSRLKNVCKVEAEVSRIRKEMAHACPW